MNTYLITDNSETYGVNLIIAVADTEEEALALINAKPTDTYHDWRDNANYKRYEVEHIDTLTKGVKHNQYYGE